MTAEPIYIKTSDTASLKHFLDRFYLPAQQSHKGQNGQLLVIGGSKLFHASPIWAAEVATYYTDIVHFASTRENNEIMASIKKQFIGGIIVPQADIPAYVREDDVVLIGPGMVRNDSPRYQGSLEFGDMLKISNEPDFTTALTQYLLQTYPDKKFVLDAGALQMMDKDWLTRLKTPAIVTPHQLEFERLFGIVVTTLSVADKIKTVTETARKYKTVILLKAVVDIISDGEQTYVIEGGNQGLTKGGTGDILAGLTAAFYTKNDPLTAAVMASFCLKRTADLLSQTYSYWFNMEVLIARIPQILREMLYNR